MSRKIKDRQSSTVSSSSSNGSTTDAKGACSASTTSSDCELRPIVSLLEMLCAPSASELGRKRKIDANLAHLKWKKRSRWRTVRICSVFSLFFCEEFLENNRALTGE